MKPSLSAMRIICFVFSVLCCLAAVPAWSQPAPVRLGLVGLAHDHARGFLPGAISRKDIQLVGIAEPNQTLAAQYAAEYKLSTNLFYASVERMLESTNVQAVATFTSTFEHPRVVEICAPRGIHVMMEKPLAVSIAHARRIETAASRGGIQVMVNYETTWYPANQTVYEFAQDKETHGELRKIVVHDGHQGPKEIGCSAAFLKWLTDPVLNGGGALTDFGCYGADLITWLMEGQRPTAVFAVTQQIKPKVYPKVDDEATIILTYPRCQGIIQASWNWPRNRKDMEVYAQNGYALAPERNLVKLWPASGGGRDSAEKQVSCPPLQAPNDDPLSYLAALVRGEMRQVSGLSSLKVNMVVTEILDAARESARTGRRVALTPPGKR